MLKSALEELLRKSIDFEPKGVSIDSRTIKKGDLFVGIKGQNFDGSDFAYEALKKGACAAIVHNDTKADRYIIKVEDTTKTLLHLASIYRKKMSAKVICITGTNGKTTTKDMIAHILSRKFSVVHAQKSFNNFVGLPLTILSAKKDTQFIIAEIGTNKKGEIAQLCDVAKPDIGVITNISEAHLEGLGNIEGVAEDKKSMLDFLQQNGIAILNLDNFYTNKIFQEFSGNKLSFGLSKEANFYATEIVEGDNFIYFKINNNFNAKLPLIGNWNVYNALAAITVCSLANVSISQAIKALSDFKPPEMRMQLFEIDGIKILNDAYNSNPVSAINAIKKFSQISCKGRRILIIGDMLELGTKSPDLHKRVGEIIKKVANIDFVVCIGNASRIIYEILYPQLRVFYFDNVHKATPLFWQIVRRQDLVLLKGSRKISLEKILKK